MERIYLGFDTSNYRTSVSAVNSRGDILFQRADLLDVEKGERGLRQSEAFFIHSNRLPGQISELFDTIDPSAVAASGASSRPRRVEGSYMPCFLAGLNAAKEISSALGIPLYEFSHQEGHAAAVLGDEKDEVVFMHLSGGTTEFLLCYPDDKGYGMKIIGGTKDISAGQLIDRIGVALGLPFPSGPYLDDMAYETLEAYGFDTADNMLTCIMPKLKLSSDCRFNLSGPETKLLKYIQGGISESEVHMLVSGVFVSLAGLLVSAADSLSEMNAIDKVYMAGGVASSRTLRRLVESTSHRADISFGDPLLSGDNAVGTALLARRMDETRQRITGK